MNWKTQSTTPSLKTWNNTDHSRSEEVTGHLWCLSCLWVHIQDWGIQVLGRSVPSDLTNLTPHEINREQIHQQTSRYVPSRNVPWWTTDPHRNTDSVDEYFMDYTVCRVWVTVSCGLVVVMTKSWGFTTCRENYWGLSNPNQGAIHTTYCPRVEVWCTLMTGIVL